MKLLTEDEAAEVLRVCRKTLYRMRVQGTGPKFIRLGGEGGPIRYSEKWIEEYLEAQAGGVHDSLPARQRMVG